MTYDPEFPDAQNPYSPPRSDIHRPADPWTIGMPSPGVVRFDAIGDAWNLFRQEMGTWTSLILLFFVVFVGILVVWALVLGGIQVGLESAKINPDAVQVIATVLVILFYGFLFVAMAVLSGGLFRAACKQIRGQPIGVGDLFGTLDIAARLAGGMILVGLASALGFVLCIIPGYLVAGRLMLVFPLIVDGRMSATEAVAQSWDALRGQTIMATLFNFIISLISGLGVWLCGFGILFTLPLYYLGIAVVYRDYFMTKPVADPWIESV